MGRCSLKVAVKIVAGIFNGSAVTVMVFTSLRLAQPFLFYKDPLIGGILVTHYAVTIYTLLVSVLAFFGNAIIIYRKSDQNEGRIIVAWMLLDSLLETSRMVYVFVTEVFIKGAGELQRVDTFVNLIQILLDSWLLSLMILRH